MRRSLTLIFVIVVVVLAAVGYQVRSLAIEDALHDHDDRLLRHGAATIALAVDERLQAGGKVDAALLSPFVDHDLGLRFHSASGRNIDLRGAGFDGPLEPDDSNRNLWSVADVNGRGYVLLSEDDDAVRTAASQSLRMRLLLLLITALLAALVATAFGRWYARPFRQLAEAAAALGRGRFQLDLPRTGIPEAKAIANALAGSARQLQDRLATEEQFAQRASHALRTPLTGIRLELEEAALHEGLPEPAAKALERSLQRVDQLDAVTGELVALARHRALVAEATTALEVLVRQVAESWHNELAARHRRLTTSVEGDALTTYTPGPVEQILEFLLVDVVHRSAGAVRLDFVAAPDGHLRIAIAAERAVAVRKTGTAPLLRARTVALALGGRLEGEYAEGGVEIVLPRR